MNIRSVSDSFVITDVLRTHLVAVSGNALVGRIRRAANGLKLEIRKEKIEHLHLWVAPKDVCLAIFDRTCKGVEPEHRKRIEELMSHKLEVKSVKRKSPFSGGTGTLYVARCKFDHSIIKPGVTCTGLRSSTRERGVELLRELDMEIVWELDSAAHLESYFLQIFSRKPPESFFSRLREVLISKGVSDVSVATYVERARRSKELRQCAFSTLEEMLNYCDCIARTYADAMMRPRKRSALANKERLHEMQLETERFKLHAAERMSELAQLEHEMQTQARRERMEEEERNQAREEQLQAREERRQSVQLRIERMKQKRLQMLLTSDKVSMKDLEHLINVGVIL